MDWTIIVVAGMGLAGTLGAQLLSNSRDDARERSEDRRADRQHDEALRGAVRDLLDEAAAALHEASRRFDNVGNVVVWIQQGRLDYRIEGQDAPVTAKVASVHELRKLEVANGGLWGLEARLRVRSDEDHPAVVALGDAAKRYRLAVAHYDLWMKDEFTGKELAPRLKACHDDIEEIERRFSAGARLAFKPRRDG